jgi:hypothetical protein
MTDEKEYTRIRANVQIGDGPDQRGDVTVETFREVDPDRRRIREVRLPDGTEVDGVPANDRVFAEWYTELQRAEDALRVTLGLPEK